MHKNHVFLAILIIASSCHASLHATKISPAPLKNPLRLTARVVLDILNTWDENPEWASGKLAMRGLDLIITNDASTIFQQMMNGVIGDKTKENRFLYYWNTINAPLKMQPKIRAAVTDIVKWPLLLIQFNKTTLAQLRESLSMTEAAAMPQDRESDDGSDWNEEL